MSHEGLNLEKPWVLRRVCLTNAGLSLITMVISIIYQAIVFSSPIAASDYWTLSVGLFCSSAASFGLMGIGQHKRRWIICSLVCSVCVIVVSAVGLAFTILDLKNFCNNCDSIRALQWVSVVLLVVNSIVNFSSMVLISQVVCSCCTRNQSFTRTKV